MVQLFTILALFMLSADSVLAADSNDSQTPAIVFADLVGTWSDRAENQPVMIGKTTGPSGNEEEVPVYSAHRYITGALVLLIRADGSYESRIENASSGCFREFSEAGTARIENGELVLWPLRNRIRISPTVTNACETANLDGPLQPVRFKIRLDRCLLLIGISESSRQYCNKTPQLPPAGAK